MLTLEKIILEYQEQIRDQYDGNSKLNSLKSNQRLLEIFSENEFNGYHVSRIVTNAGWSDKLDWIAENFETAKKYGLKHSFITAKMQRKDWRAYLPFVAT